MLLQKNYLVLEKIVEELLEYEILTGKVCSSTATVKLNLILLATFAEIISVLVSIYVIYRLSSSVILIFFLSSVNITRFNCFSD